LNVNQKSIADYNRKKKAEKSGRGFAQPSGGPKDKKDKKESNKSDKDQPIGNKVRYETPFHVKCEKCQQQIAKGVRFNANKRAIGKFHSTTILEFSFNCKCGNRIKVETDPEKCDYKYVAGKKFTFNLNLKSN
jgi:hypothetical protein